MKVIAEKRWICDGRHGSPSLLSTTSPDSEHWRIHGLGCVRLTRHDDVLSVAFDGRAFGWELCERLLVEFNRYDRAVSRVDFAVWSAEPDGTGDWIRHSASTVLDACGFVRRVAVVATAWEGPAALTARPMKLERLLLERRGIFDEVIAAWLLDRGPGNATIGRLFGRERETAKEGLKIVRRFGDNLSFEAYRTPTAHAWMEDQSARMPGSDLGIVPDGRMAQSLRNAVQQACEARGPFLERVVGLAHTHLGRKFTEYFRLSLPLHGDGADDGGMMLIATRW